MKRGGLGLLVLFIILVVGLIIIPLTYSKYVTTFNRRITINVRVPEYEVAFVSNPPSGKTATGSMANQDFIYGTADDLDANKYAVKDYIFLGWNTKADGSGTSYDDEDSVTDLSSIDGDVINFYAQWRAREVSNIVDGRSLAGKLKALVGQGDHYGNDSQVTSMTWATSAQYEAVKSTLTSDNVISKTGSDKDTYIWFDDETGDMYFYSEADDLKMSGNMERAFNKFNNLRDISALSHFDTSEVTDMNRMFQNCYKITDLSPLKDWDVSGVTDMTFMFGSSETSKPMAISSLDPLKDWDVSSVTSFYQTFKVCASITNLDALKDWDVSSATNFAQMFNRCGLTDATAIENWDIRSVPYTTNTSSAGWGMMLANMSTLTDDKKPIFTLWPGTWNGATYLPSTTTPPVISTSGIGSPLSMMSMQPGDLLLNANELNGLNNILDAQDTNENMDDIKGSEVSNNEETKQEEINLEENKTEETNQEEIKPEENKTEETKQEETKTEETKQEETKTEENKAEETKQEETKPEENKTEETK